MAAFKVNITKNGNAIKFQFTDSDHYLYGSGVVEVPVNSLSLVIDESDFVTFKKASTNDTFITFDPANSNLSDKAGVIEFYKENMVGSTGGGGSESGITSGDVQTMIDESLDDYYDKDEVDAAFETVNASLSGKADASDVTAVANDVSTLSGQVATKVATSDFNAYSAATDARLAEDEEVTAAALNDLNDRIGSGGGALFVDFDDLMNNMNDDKWDELVNAIQNNKPIFYYYNGSDEYITDAGQTPVDGYVFFQTEGEEGAEIGLKQLYGGGWYGVTIIKNGSEDYDVSDYGEDYQPLGDYQPLLQAGSGISIDSNNVISVTGGSSVTVDSAITSASTNAVENRAIYDKVTMEVGDDTIEYDDEPVTATTSGSRYYKVVFNDPDQVVTFTVAGLPDTIKLDGNTGQITYTNGGALPEGVVTSFTNPALATYEVAFGYDVTSAVVTSGGDIIYVGHKGTTTEWVKDVVGDLLETVSDKADTSAVTAAIDAATSGKVDTSAITSAITSGSTDDEIPTAKAVYDATQSGGGGATYSAGTNISIDSANTINCTLPITANSATSSTFIAGNPSSVVNENILIGSTSLFRSNYKNNVVIGNVGTKASNDCVVIGRNATGGTNNNYDWYNVAIGSLANANGGNHVALGYSATATGTTKMNLNNQITVDTNNQVYIKDKTNTTDVCIQDAIAALGGLKFVQCTQAEYDSMVSGGTVDSSTIYFITNVVS